MIESLLGLQILDDMRLDTLKLLATTADTVTGREHSESLVNRIDQNDAGIVLRAIKAVLPVDSEEENQNDKTDSR